MYVVYATGQYITGPNDDGGLCDTVTFQQASKYMHIQLECGICAFAEMVVRRARQVLRQHAYSDQHLVMLLKRS